MSLCPLDCFRRFYLLAFALTCSFFFIIPDAVIAQSGLDAQNLSNVRSSDISDEQLRRYASRADAEGYTMEEVFQLARQRGLPAAEAQRLRQRVRDLDLRTEEQDSINTEGSEEAGQREYIRPRRIETEQMRRTFGSQIFREQQTEFTPLHNMPTPVSYTLGAGDELVVNIWGDQTNTHRLTVSPEGTVDIDNLGPVQVNGLNITEANDRIIRELQSLYSGLNPGNENQTTFARVSLSRLRSIQVSLIGEVTNPGDYSVSSNATVFNVLYRAGGPDENGSYRNIRVIRDNEIIAELDLYDFLVDGIQTGNIRLRNQDVIQIRPYRNRVEVQGEVKRSGLFFEMREGETLDDLIRYAGHFTDRAYTRQLRVHRNTSSERRIVTVDREQFGEFPVHSGDVLYIDEILDRFENRVTITGAVWRSGEFELSEGMTLHDLIREADGLRPDAFMTRGLINRMRDDYTFEQINFDVAALLENPEEYDVPLQREDYVRIRSIHDMQDEQSVKIEGAVRARGTFTYRDNMTLEDLILQADGFSKAASEAHIEISRRIIGEPSPEQRGRELAEIYTFEVTRDLRLQEEDRTFRLQPFDQVYVHRRPDYQEQQTVTIEGEVLHPGTYTLRSRNERISDLIARAGGLTGEAYSPGARLARRHTSIDRPVIQLDFLSEDDIVNFNDLDLGRDTEPDDPQEEDRERNDRQNIESHRTQLNRLTRDEADPNSPGAESEQDTAEARIGINLDAILQNPGSQDDLFLREGDVLRIPQELQTVAITGAVMQDVEVRYHEGRNLRYYIDRAGGYAENAREGHVYIVYANGDVDRRKKYLFGLIRKSPHVEPGAQIIIPEKRIREGMSTGEIISISSVVVSMTTSVLIAIDRLSR